MDQAEKTISQKLIENKEALKLSPNDTDLLAEKEKLTTQKEVEDWLELINTLADEKAEELARIFNCIVEPVVYVIKEKEDAAVGFIKKPDTKQSFKLLRALGENFENGLELAARSQLIRDLDLSSRGLEGTASDPRFMDVDGKCSSEYSDLNLSLLFKMQGLVKPFANQFKKK